MPVWTIVLAIAVLAPLSVAGCMMTDEDLPEPEPLAVGTMDETPAGWGPEHVPPKPEERALRP